MTERELFIAALRLPDADARAAFLEAACADKPLRERVESMLRDHEQLGSFLESPTAPPAMTADDHRGWDGPGTVIGPYKLLEPIGEGGMGTVFMAEQTQPVRRTVALKVIKPGMDSRQVLARFEVERQALALMDHPNIAKVFEAGTTEQGRPYFVMELVKGAPITRYCDEKRMTPRERLEVFLPVCQAVQHAHQKGVIHRDLKPSNVLVGLYDGVPVPKVIDFGVAKATGQKLTEATLFTGFGAVVGTPEYMSPEQAQPDNLDVDTRSDVYALGALLYELLTGTTPLNRKRLKEAALLEVLRVIREEEPPRPSTRLSTTEELPSIAACRNVEPRRLSRLMRGELDWIVMKALEKDRNRRYETASGLAADLRRHLDGEPVQACPPSARYRFRKFARRNRVALAMASVVATALFAVGVAGVFAYRNRVTEQRRLAEQRQNALEMALMAAMSGDFAAADKRTDEAELLGASTAQMRLLRSEVAYYRGDMAAANQHLEQAVKLLPVGQPGAVAARALLALACSNALEGPRFVALAQELDQLSPITTEDFLFKGQVEAQFRPERSLQTIDEAIRRRDSVVARIARTDARANHALLTGELRSAELALDDALVIRGMQPNNPLVLGRSVYAHLLAAGLYEGAGRRQDSDRVLAQARRDVQELERFSSSLIAARACFDYYAYVDDEPAAYAMSQNADDFRHALMLYGRGKFTEALKATERNLSGGRGNWMDRVQRGFILAELPDGPARARIAYQEAMAHTSVGWQMIPPMILLLLGEKEAAVRAYTQLRKDVIKTRHDDWDWLDGWSLKDLDYNCGLITAEELLNAAGRSPMKLCDAHWEIGLWRLSTGDGAGAQDHWRKCVATRDFENWAWLWARVFLARMQKDPSWPPWIPKVVGGKDRSEVSEPERLARVSVPR
jgi:serine/threonine protein kinase